MAEFVRNLSILTVSYLPDVDLPNYRFDKRCGPDYLAPNGQEAVCLGTCCSIAGWCGIGEEHCGDHLHMDYRETGKTMHQIITTFFDLRKL